MRRLLPARGSFVLAAVGLALGVVSAGLAPDRTERRPGDRRRAGAAYIPIVASTTDPAGVRLVSFLSLANPHPFPLTVTAYLLPAGTDNRGFRASAKTIHLVANGATRIADPLATLWGTSGFATIYLESRPGPDNDGAFIAESRLVHLTDSDATYGLSVPATLSGFTSSERGYAADIESDARFRTEIGLLNDSGSRTTVRVEILAEDGTVIGSKEYELAPFSLVYDAVSNITSSCFSHASARVTPSADFAGQIIGYVAVVDQTTNSAVLSLLQPHRSPSGGATAVVIELSRYRYSPGSPDGPPIRLRAGVTYDLIFRSIDTAHGISAIPQLGIAGSTEIRPGNDYVVTVSPTEAQSGRYNFTCTRFCGSGHGGMYGSIEVE